MYGEGRWLKLNLTIARQGRNAWWRYPLSLLVALPLIVVMVLRGVPLSDNEMLMREPLGFFGMAIVASGLMAFGLVVAIAAIHQRP